jgi:N-carbamoyl-L-amino-acid hydrolase
VLESQSLDVGIVTSIVGIRRIEIVFEGEADHAGTTPMTLRHDALVAAADTVVSVRRAAEQLAAEGAGYFVATVGILTVDPSASNIVPGRSRLVIDIRTTDSSLTKQFVETIDRESSAHARTAQVARARLRRCPMDHPSSATKIYDPNCVRAPTNWASSKWICRAAPGMMPRS